MICIFSSSEFGAKWINIEGEALDSLGSCNCCAVQVKMNFNVLLKEEGSEIFLPWQIMRLGKEQRDDLKYSYRVRMNSLNP